MDTIMISITNITLYCLLGGIYVQVEMWPNAFNAELSFVPDALFVF